MTGVAPAVVAAASALSAVAGIRHLARDGVRLRLPAGGVLVRVRRGRELAGALERAGVRLGADAFVLCTAAAAVMTGLCAWLLLRTLLIAVVAASAVGFAAWVVVASADRRYLERFSRQLPVVAQQLSGAIGAGLSLRQAITRTAADAPEPAATELRRLATDLDLGARIDAALEATVERVPDPGLRTLVTAVLVQRIVGGNLSHALADLSRRLEERSALEREARSATAQARMSAWLVAGLPLAGGVLVEIAAPGTLARTLGRGPGLGLVVAATVLQIAGVMLIRRIVDRDGVG